MRWLLFALALSSAFAADEIQIDPKDGSLDAYSSMRVFFPKDMVMADKIDAKDAQSPIVSQPEVNAEFIWRTQSQGVWSVNGPRVPGVTYRFTLRPELKDLEGNALAQANWSAEFATDPLRVDSYYGERTRLSSQPQIALEFNYLINLNSIPGGAWIQDRATRQRFPVEVMLNRPTAEGISEVVEEVKLTELPASLEFRVRPRDPLPVGRGFDLVVDGVTDSFAGKTMPYPRVFPLGQTRSLEVDYVAARNWPTDQPQIEIKFKTPIKDGILPLTAIKVTPAVSGMHFRVAGEGVFIEGKFDIAQKYRVEISTAVRDDRGYSLAAPSIWGATFAPKVATLLFPEGEIRQRSSLGLRFALLQVNTGAVTWKLARVPAEKLAEVAALGANIPKNGDSLLIEKLGIETVGRGELPASGNDKEELRKIEWKPATPLLGGAYLFEASASNSAGGTVANRSLIYFSEYSLTQKSSPDKTWIRVAGMSDGQPVKGVEVQLVTKDLSAIASAATDDKGIAIFPGSSLVGARYLMAKTPDASTVLPLEPRVSFPSGSLRQEPLESQSGVIFTDRPLYRPGQEVKIKGMLRARDAGTLKIAAGEALTWEIRRRDEVLATGKTKLSADGGWDAAWNIPVQGALGEYSVRCLVNGKRAGDAAEFSVEEYRNPPFVVSCEGPEKNFGKSTVQVSSEYFHGAPNVSSLVRWTAEWITVSSEDEFKRTDEYSKLTKEPTFSMEAHGESALDANGRITLSCEPPFTDPGNRTRASVYWKVEVTGPDGQTIGNRFIQSVELNPVSLGVITMEGKPGELAFELNAAANAPGAVVPAQAKAELFLVQTKSVKERIAPHIYRYRNTDEFVPTISQTVPATGNLVFKPKPPGRYVLVISPLEGNGAIVVSEESWLAAPGEAEVPVRSDDSLKVVPPDEKNPATVGKVAKFQIQAPSPGIAWVSVETNTVLDTYTMAIDGNATSIEVPIKPEYEPNAFVSVYLLRPGGADNLPGEMFGYTNVDVANPSRELKIAASVERSDYEPRQTVRGSVAVTADGQPVANAEVAIYAVDDSVLKLGDWSLPEFLSTFFPDRDYGVVTYLALRRLIDKIGQESLTQKGFTVGGGGKDEFSPAAFTRKDFKPLILWLPAAKTDARGTVNFECETPDNLTRFRVVALGQTRQNQFGAGDTTFTVSKKLLIEPALPRFLREGDEVELRAVARQKVSENDPLKITCEVGEGLQLLGEGTAEAIAPRDVPAVAKFKAKVLPGTKSVWVKFAARSTNDAKLEDSVEVTLPVASPNIQVAESVAGKWTGPNFAAGEHSRSDWKDANGQFSLTLSTSPYLTKLMGIPYLLEYPHGCFEQKSSRLLTYTALSQLLAFIPESDAQRENYGKIIEESLQEFSVSLLPDKTLPFWPNGTDGNLYVTIQSTWALLEASNAGFTVPDELYESLAETVQKVITRHTRETAEPSLRAFALFVVSQFEDLDVEAFNAAVEELYLQRDKLNDEGRALLALALYFNETHSEWQEQLVREIPDVVNDRRFDPRTFASTTRSEAMAIWAKLAIHPDKNQKALRERLDYLMESSQSLSTQENLWLLLAFNELIASQKIPALANAASPKVDAVSSNAASGSWNDQDLAKIAEFTIRKLGKTGKGTFVVQASRQLPLKDQQPLTNGMRLSRVIKNLTDPARTGSPEAPLQLGDEILISYRIQSDKSQSYLALEDALPAGLEMVNPNLAMFAKTFSIPDEPGLETAMLSHSEMRDKQTNLYFDDFPAGSASYAVLARATSAGTFAWPSTQISPMYDSRFQARTAPSQCVVVSK